MPLNTADGRRVCTRRFRTELCKSYMATGHCKYHNRCMYAHGYDLLRTEEMNREDGLNCESAIRAWAKAHRPSGHMGFPPTPRAPHADSDSDADDLRPTTTHHHHDTDGGMEMLAPTTTLTLIHNSSVEDLLLFKTHDGTGGVCEGLSRALSDGSSSPVPEEILALGLLSSATPNGIDNALHPVSHHHHHHHHHVRGCSPAFPPTHAHVHHADTEAATTPDPASPLLLAPPLLPLHYQLQHHQRQTNYRQQPTPIPATPPTPELPIIVDPLVAAMRRRLPPTVAETSPVPRAATGGSFWRHDPYSTVGTNRVPASPTTANPSPSASQRLWTATTSIVTDEGPTTSGR